MYHLFLYLQLCQCSGSWKWIYHCHWVAQTANENGRQCLHVWFQSEDGLQDRETFQGDWKITDCQPPPVVQPSWQRQREHSGDSLPNSMWLRVFESKKLWKSLGSARSASTASSKINWNCITVSSLAFTSRRLDEGETAHNFRRMLWLFGGASLNKVLFTVKSLQNHQNRRQLLMKDQQKIVARGRNHIPTSVKILSGIYKTE